MASAMNWACPDMYLLDANVFIEAKDRHFGFDICPGFWEWLVLRHKAGTVFSIEAVREELLHVDDELKKWTLLLDSSFFLAPDPMTIPHMATLSTWANSPARLYVATAISEFLKSADYMIAAQAKATGLTVVTHEVSHPEARKRIMLPDACAHLGVETIGAYEFMRREGLRLILEPTIQQTR